jgi:hypothetical protein
MEWSDEETTELQFAIDAEDVEQVRRLLAPRSADQVSNLQFYGNSTAFMYALRRSSPAVVRAFLEKGVTPFELPWSDNNELKSALSNPKHAATMVELALEVLPRSLAVEMIRSDWNPEDNLEAEEPALSAWELAERHPDPRCRELLAAALNRPS